MLQLGTAGLSGKTPSQETVDGAIKSFTELKCLSVRDYLLHYLKLDLSILLNCTERLFDKLEDIVGIHPVTTRRFSLSSFSFLASQVKLMENLRPGCYCANHCAIFAALKRGTRGGVSVVTRNSSGSLGDYADAECNAHIITDFEDDVEESNDADDNNDYEDENAGNLTAATSSSATPSTPRFFNRPFNRRSSSKKSAQALHQISGYQQGINGYYYYY